MVSFGKPDGRINILLALGVRIDLTNGLLNEHEVILCFILLNFTYDLLRYILWIYWVWLDYQIVVFYNR